MRYKLEERDRSAELKMLSTVCLLHVPSLILDR